MKFGITAKIAALASVLVLLMTGITGLTFYNSASRVLTSQEFKNLGDDTLRLAYFIDSNVREQRTQVWGLAQRERQDSVAWKLLHALEKDGRHAAGASTADLATAMEKKLRDLLTSK